MPRDYVYVCPNGHEERRYRNARRCRLCGALVARRDFPTPHRAIDLRPEVLAFAAEMERNLRANDNKGGWRGMRIGPLVRRLREETEELCEALILGDRPAIRSEAADVGNIAMMIADVSGALG